MQNRCARVVVKLRRCVRQAQHTWKQWRFYIYQHFKHQLSVMFVHPCEFFCCFRETLHVARNATETALERHGVDRRLWCDILCAAGAVEAVFSGRFELVVQTLQETKIAHAQWACILNTSAVVEAIYAKSLAATLKLLGNIPHDAWTGILRSRAASAAVAQNCFPEITAAMVLAPVPLWACILSTRGALQAVYRRNLTRVTEALAEVEPELWAQIMDSDGFAQAVAQDDVAQITGALQHVPGRFWADILNTNGAFESIYWRNFPELTASLHKHKVPMDDWASFLHMSTQEVYDALYNDASSWQ